MSRVRWTVVILLLLFGADPARAQGLCDMVPSSAGEKVAPVDDGCIIDFPPTPGGDVGWRIILQRYDDRSQACALFEEKRASEPRNEPRAQMVDLAASYPAGGFESSHGQWAAERMEGATRVVDIHAARFRIAFCQPPYLFDAWASYIPKDAPAVPAEVVEDLRSRARAVFARIGGGMEEAVAAGLVSLFDSDGVTQNIHATLAELTRLGIVAGDPDQLVLDKARDPAVQAVGRRVSELVGNRPFAVLTDDEARAVLTLGAAAILGSVTDVNGDPAFPASAANLRLLETLAQRAVDRSDPVAAHQAATAMERYANMLRTMDHQMLLERHGVDAPAESETKS